MGIDYLVKSKINPNMYAEDDPNMWLKYALKNIEWIEILNLLNINLAALYDSAINYWASDQVKDMYEMIEGLDEDPYNLYGPWKKEELEPHMIKDIEKAIKLKDDISVLKEYFEFLVANEAYIEVS
jgi:hypothetical protein